MCLWRMKGGEVVRSESISCLVSRGVIRTIQNADKKLRVNFCSVRLTWSRVIRCAVGVGDQSQAAPCLGPACRRMGMAWALALSASGFRASKPKQAAAPSHNALAHASDPPAAADMPPTKRPVASHGQGADRKNLIRKIYCKIATIVLFLTRRDGLSND